MYPLQLHGDLSQLVPVTLQFSHLLAIALLVALQLEYPFLESLDLFLESVVQLQRLVQFGSLRR